MIQQKSQNLNPEKAEILGLLCAEGSYYNYLSVCNEFFKNRGKYYTIIKMIEAIEFTNLDWQLLTHFRNLMFSVYNYAPGTTGVKTSLKIRIKRKTIIEDLIKFTEFGCMKWKVPKELLKNEVKKLGKFSQKELSSLVEKARKEKEMLQIKKDEMTKKKYWVI